MFTWGGNEEDYSDGGQLQCDCTVGGCTCTAWGPWVPRGQIVPSEVRCTDCKAGRHKD